MSPTILSSPFSTSARVLTRAAAQAKFATAPMSSALAVARRAWAVRLNRVSRPPGSLWDGTLLDRLRTPPTRRWD